MKNIKLSLVLPALIFVLVLRAATTNLSIHHKQEIIQYDHPTILPPTKIAYAITISKCESLANNVLQSAPLLAHHVRAMSIQKTNRTKYDYQLYAFASRTQVNASCVTLLERMGYTVLLLDIPVHVTNISNEFYKGLLETNGCCGAHEFLKLYAYTLTKYPVVIHLDVDTMILQPLEDLIDYFVFGKPEKNIALSKLQVMRPTRDTNNNTNFQAMFTRDYQQVGMLGYSRNYQHVPVQGGFFAVRPNMTVFQELTTIVQHANYTVTGGWGGIMNSQSCWGDPQIQGLLGYYYSFVQPDHGLELHHCYYNNILDNPTFNGTMCTMSDMEECTDCRITPPSQVKISHPIFCHKPWSCPKWGQGQTFKRSSSCRWYLNKWYSTRKVVEEEWSVTQSWNKTIPRGDLLTDIFLGYCHENRTVIPMDFTLSSLMY
jgi:hypothetical protein